MLPPDFTTFWNQARQQGFRPKIASIGKAILFPVSVQSLGKSGHNLSSEVWWGPDHPFKSSLNGMSCKQLSDDFVAASGKQWTPPIGGTHAMLEGVIESLKTQRGSDQSGGHRQVDGRTGFPNNYWTNSNSARTTCRPLPARMSAEPRSPAVSGGSALMGSSSLVTVDNQTAPEVPLGGKMEPLA